MIASDEDFPFVVTESHAVISGAVDAGGWDEPDDALCDEDVPAFVVDSATFAVKTSAEP